MNGLYIDYNVDYMKKVAVILSGCGVFDGAEIHESVLTMLALDKAGAEIVCAAPEITQKQVMNHLTAEPEPDETRNVLVEAARIARGKIKSLEKLGVDEVDAVILPGGFGAATNLSNYADKQEGFEVEPSLAAFLERAHAAGKPIGFICIAPAIAARLFGGEQVEFTIGNDEATAATLEKTGAKHISCPVDNAVADTRLKIVTTPAYMLAKSISEAESGITKLVQLVLELA